MIKGSPLEWNVTVNGSISRHRKTYYKAFRLCLLYPKSNSWLFQRGLLHVLAHIPSVYRRYKILLSPLRPSSLCAPSPPPARLFGPHQHCLLLRAVRPWPGAFRFLRSAHGPSLPEIQHKNSRYFVSLQTWGTRMKAWSQLIISQLWFILTCKQRLQNERKKAWSLTFAATSALISSWVSARRFLASSVLRSHSAMKDSRWSTAFRRKKQKHRQEIFTSAHLKPLILAAGGYHSHQAQRTGLSP